MKYFTSIYKRALICLAFSGTIGFTQASNHIHLAVGTYTKGTESKGIYLLEINPTDGKSKILFTQSGINNPSFLNFSQDGKYLFSVGENNGNSVVQSFRFLKDSLKLRPISSANVDGENPCFITSSDLHVITANYSSGSLNVFEIDKQAKLSGPVQVIMHSGIGPNTSRQESSHVHQTIFSPDGKYLLCNDLGNDKIYSYRYHDSKSEQSHECDKHAHPLSVVDSLLPQAGSGPRHLAFNDSGNILYLLHELDGSISIISMTDGHLKLIKRISMIQEDKGPVRAADIHLSPDGKFLYATNRDNYSTLSLFRIENEGKDLKFLKEYSSHGKTPRNFMISRDGRYLILANQDSNNIIVYKRDILTGELTRVEKDIVIPSPVCLLEF